MTTPVKRGPNADEEGGFSAAPHPDVPSLDECRRILTAEGMPCELVDGEVRGVPMRVWKNIPLSLRSVLETARGHGSRTAIVYGDERIDYRGFYRAAAVLAARFVADGLQKGDRVAIAMRNLPEWPIAYFAAAAAGAIVVPLNAWGTAGELAYGLDDCGARFAVVDGERLERVVGELNRLTTLERLYVTRHSGVVPANAVALEVVIGGTGDWSDLADTDLPPVSIDADDVATIYYSSGTTGRPKGVYATHRATLSNIAALAFVGGRVALRSGKPLPAPAAEQKASLVGLPLFHVTGCNIVLVPAINAGNKLVIMRKWDVERAFELIEQERITSSGGVPALSWQLLEHPRRREFDLSSIERINWGGAPGSPELERGMRAAFPGVALSTGWGMTETCGIHTDIAGPDFEAHPNSCGTPVGDYRLETRDAQGHPLPPGSVGELWAFGANAAVGYWKQPDATAETFVDGWVRTGDIGRIDHEGYCYIVDRAKDMLIRGGENIYCIEVENALYEHPAVLDAAVVGVPHRTLGEEPAAAITVRAGHSVRQDELRAFVAERLAAFKVPVRIAFSNDPLPRNAQGKILKPSCKVMLEG